MAGNNSNTSIAQRKIKVNDRVRRLVEGSISGVVKEVKTEVTATTSEAREKGLMVTVLWDNGTYSYVGPESIEVVKE